MAGKNDYGYFGSGAEGYAHYKQTFDSTMKGSHSGGSSGSSGSGRLPTMKEIERMTPEERKKLSENLDKANEKLSLYLMIVIPIVIILLYLK